MRSNSRSKRSPSLPASPLDQAKALALRVLSFHARSASQLRTRLARGGFEGEAEEVVAWAARLGYLDDAAYALARARALLGPGRAGPRRAEQQLRNAGLSAAEASAAVAAALAERASDLGRAEVGDLGSDEPPDAERGSAEPPETALCRAALALRLKRLDPGALDDRARARLARWLLGRGFSEGVVARVLGVEADLDA